MISSIRLATTLGGALLLAAAAVQAGDPQAGRDKAATCMGCHGVPSYMNVYPTYHVPRLGGQHPEYLEAALQAYRDGSRKHATMQAQAATLSDEDIADIAAYFATYQR
ncbi:MAG TPA: cytochrome c [Thioalkalivibrio sp.]|nr:cytochrome c [Thioalkalivibrio sp.]